MSRLQVEEYVEHKGVVKQILDNAILVGVIPNSACAECHVGATCSANSGQERIIEISGSEDSFEVGEIVFVKIYKRSGLMAVCYAFAFPLLFLFASAFAVFHLCRSEPLAALSGFVSVVLYYMLLFFFRSRLKRKFTFKLEKI